MRSAQKSQLIVLRTRTKYGDRSFAVQEPRIWNSLPAELRAPDEFRDFLMANVTQGLNDLDTTSKQTSRLFVLAPIDFSYITSYRLSIGPSNQIFALERIVYPQFTDDDVDRRRRTQHY